MKKNKTAQGCLVNAVVVAVLFAGAQALTAALGSTNGFKLVAAASTHCSTVR